MNNSGSPFRLQAAVILKFAILLVAQAAFAGNPLIKDIGVSDPHIRVHGDKVYLYSGHDSSPTDNIWVMKDWRVYSSTDLIHWDLETTISPKDNYMADDSTDCWACDAASRNGQFYFYFSDRKRSIGVMSASSPGGPFQDALGVPLVAPLHDPTILTDDDSAQTPYLIYGDKSGGGYQIARLNSDMISLGETPRTIQITGTQWDQAPAWMDKNYLFKRNGTYYLSWGTDYATSTNIYGPYQCVGSTGQGFGLNSFAHGSFFEWKGQFYHVWCYYLDNSFKYRETIMTYCHFDNAGNIVDDTGFLEQHFATGMGQYDASWPRIEAEWFYEKSPALRKQDCAEGGFEITDIQSGGWLRFANLDFGTGVNSLEVRVSSAGPDAQIEVRRDSPSGQLLGTVAVSGTGGPTQYGTFTGALQGAVGVQEVYLKFTGGSGNLLRLNWSRFTNQTLALKANAGLDQTITDFDSNGSETVTLNGTASFAGMSPITNYIWTESGANIATGDHPDVNLGVGTHVITLTTTEYLGGTDSDTVVVTVSPFGAPVDGILYSDVTDSAPRSNGSIISSTADDSTLFVGRAGSAPGLDRSPVFVFRLPDLGAVANPFASASFRIDYMSNNSGTPTTADVDLYGLGSRVLPTVLGSDYYGESAELDPTDSVLIQTGILNTTMVDENTGFGIKTTSPSGNAALLNYLNSQYASGDGRLKYVFLRLSSQAAMPLNVRYVVTSANGATSAANSSVWPQINFTALSPYPDTDADRMPDPWEMQSFNTLAHTGDGDQDGDGNSNADEYVAATNPKNSQSNFRPRSVNHDSIAGYTVTWDSVPNRTYRVMKSTSLTGVWTAASAPISGNGGKLLFTDPSVSAAKSFYKIQVSIP